MEGVGWPVAPNSGPARELADALVGLAWPAVADPEVDAAGPVRPPCVGANALERATDALMTGPCAAVEGLENLVAKELRDAHLHSGRVRGVAHRELCCAAAAKAAEL